MIELSGCWGFKPPSSFFTPQLILKNYLGGVRLNPPRTAFSNSMYLVLCLHPKISNTCEFQDDPIIRCYDSLVDFLFLYIYAIYAAMYNITSVLWITRDQKLKRGRVLYRVAQNKWDHLLKLYMGCLLTIKINYNGIVVSICVFSMVKPVQCLLNMDGKRTLSISDYMFHII